MASNAGRNTPGQPTAGHYDDGNASGNTGSGSYVLPNLNIQHLGGGSGHADHATGGDHTIFQSKQGQSSQHLFGMVPSEGESPSPPAKDEADNGRNQTSKQPPSQQQPQTQQQQQQQQQQQPLPTEPKSQPGDQPAPAEQHGPKPDSPGLPQRILTMDEQMQLFHALGVARDAESGLAVHPTSSVWPARGLQDGLYRDVVVQRTKFFYLYHSLGTVRWICMVLQIVLSATLTALGALPNKDGIAITTISAVNVSVAGILALMHNTGVPERHRSNKNEYQAVEDHLKNLIDSGLTNEDWDITDVLQDCFLRYRSANATVQANATDTYTSSAVLGDPKFPPNTVVANSKRLRAPTVKA